MNSVKKICEHLYIHIPFCTHVCPYCGFYKHKITASLLKPFIFALRTEIKHVRRNFDLQLKTIYFGGGTPSALSLSFLKDFFQGWPWWREVEEFTFECNPATLSLEKIIFLKKIGVNRISLGIQSFDANFLKLLGRVHSREQVIETLKKLRSCGFDNINFDLMFALPHQTLDQWKQTLDEALSLHPQHISAYNLNFEENAPFFKNDWQADESLQKEMFLYSREFLEKNGFEHYEISNFARKKFQSIHNFAYWEGKDYLGLGPSACSTIGNTRYQNTSDTLAYIASLQKNNIPDRTEEPLSKKIKLTEKIFLGLRTSRGVELQILSPWQTHIENLLRENLAKIQNHRLILTAKGFLLADEISQIFA